MTPPEDVIREIGGVACVPVSYYDQLLTELEQVTKAASDELAEYNADIESLVEKLQAAQAESVKTHERLMSLEDHVMRLEQNLLEAAALLKYANPKAKDPVVQRRWKEARRRVVTESGRPVR